MRPEQARVELNALPGGDGPVRFVCRAHSGMTVRQLPIQLRDELAPTVTDTAFTECMDVLTVLVSVAMVEGDTTEEGLGTILDRVAGAESQDLVDACDEHYRAWRLLLNRDDPLRVTPRTGGEFETRQYEGWMDRCFRVLRPVSR